MHQTMWDDNLGGIREMVNNYENNIPEEYLSSSQGPSQPTQRPPVDKAQIWMQGYAERMMEQYAVTNYSSGNNQMAYTYSEQESEEYAFGFIEQDKNDMKRTVNNNSLDRPSGGWAEAIAQEYGITLFQRGGGSAGTSQGESGNQGGGGIGTFGRTGFVQYDVADSVTQINYGTGAGGGSDETDNDPDETNVPQTNPGGAGSTAGSGE